MKKGLIYAGSGILGAGLLLYLYNRFIRPDSGVLYSGGEEEEEYTGESSEEEEEEEYSQGHGWGGIFH